VIYCKKIQSHVPTDGQSVSMSRCRVHSGTCDQPDIIFCLKVAVLSLWGAHSDERTGMSPEMHRGVQSVDTQPTYGTYLFHSQGRINRERHQYEAGRRPEFNKFTLNLIHFLVIRNSNITTKINNLRCGNML
jgi:hypothetical protein